MKRIVAMGMTLVLCLIASVLGTSAVGANGTHSADVDVIHRANGSVDITGDNLDNIIEFCSSPDGGIAVKIFLAGELVSEPSVNATTDIRVNLRGGDDLVSVNGSTCTDETDVLIPRDFRITLGSGNDTVDAYEFHVGRNMTILGGSGDENIDVYEATVEGRALINAASGQSAITVFDGTTFGRTNIRGGTSRDLIRILDTDIGRNPVVQSSSGNDSLTLQSVDATGRINVNTGAGDDSIDFVNNSEREYDVNFVMGSGTDFLLDIGSLRAGDRVNGGSGSQDHLLVLSGDLDGVVVRGFETVELPDVD